MTDQQTSTFSLYEEVRARPVDSDDCWLYAGKMNAYGYGFITSGRKLRAMAHRAMYETIIGPIPEGLQLDHLCRVTQCINPDHLEPVTPRVNVLRSHSVTSAKARQTHASGAIRLTTEIRTDMKTIGAVECACVTFGGNDIGN